jgi:16S rRNA processing protein RimM
LSSSTDRVVVGRIGRPHGLDGEVTILPDSDDPDRFCPGAGFLTDTGRELVLRSSKPYRDRGLVVGFDGIRSRIEAEQLRGAILTVARAERRSLGDGEFWPDDLVGLTVIDPAGTRLGVVDRVEFGSAQDRLVVRTDTGGDVLVPFVEDLVGDPDGDRIVVDAPEGLFP